MIASHYATPVTRHLATATSLRSAPSDDAEPIVELARGDLFEMLDDSLGWAWGYAGAERRVGYVPAKALDL